MKYIRNVLLFIYVFLWSPFYQYKEYSGIVAIGVLFILEHVDIVLQIATEMTMVVGNLLDANESVIIESNTRNHSSERYVYRLLYVLTITFLSCLEQKRDFVQCT